MYVDRCTAKGAGGKTYTRYLLRESKRQGKKTIKTTILNITPWGEQVCEAIHFALKHQKRLKELDIAVELNKVGNAITLTQDKPIGDVWLLHQMAMKTKSEPKH